MQKILFGFQRIIEYFINKLESHGNILMFHSINDSIEEWKEPAFCISLETFSDLITKLEKVNIKFCAISNLSNKSKKNEVYITFDDAYADVYNYAYPILKEKEIPFSIFISTKYIDKENYLSKKMIEDFSKDDLCTIGAHTINHPILRYCQSSEAYNEIYKGKSNLEKLINNSIDYFAFPYGSIYACSLFNIQQVRECGFKFAFSTLNSHINKYSILHKYFIPRLNVNEINADEIYKKIVKK